MHWQGIAELDVLTIGVINKQDIIAEQDMIIGVLLYKQDRETIVTISNCRETGLMQINYF